MKSNKLYFVFVFMLVFVLACGSLAYAKKGVRFVTDETDPETITAFTEIIDEFEKTHPDIEVIPEYVSYEDIFLKVMSMVRAGMQPALFYTMAAQMVSLHKLEVLEPLDDVIDDLGRDDFTANILDLATIDGTVYGVPIQTGEQALFYRSDLYEENGLEEPANTDDVIAIAEKLTKDLDGDNNVDIYGMSIMTASEPNSQAHFIDELWRRSGYILDQKGDIAFSTLYRNESIESLNFLKKLTEYAPPGFISHGYFEEGMNYVQGKTAMVYYPFRLVSHVRNNNPDLLEKTKAMFPPLPPKGGTKSMWGGPNVWVLFKDAPNTEEAKEFVKFFMTGANYAKFLRTVPFHLVPVRMSMMNSPEFLEDPLIKSRVDFLQLAMDSLPYVRDLSKEHPDAEVSEIVGVAYGGLSLAKNMNSFYSGQISAEEVLDKTAEEWLELGDWKLAE
ncbi:MAG: extracellular solute-binding protein [Candidatus Atribacteria bacterium]|nr:extracellular solute-binding protein [Candidatus Atribacteria bacterium]